MLNHKSPTVHLFIYHVMPVSEIY